MRAENVLREGEADAELVDGPYVRLSVGTTACGISADEFAASFRPLFSTKAHGTGLGLATAYSIVRKHDGRIAVDSVPGVGSIFRVWLAGHPPGAGSRGGGRERPDPAPLPAGRAAFSSWTMS